MEYMAVRHFANKRYCVNCLNGQITRWFTRCFCFATDKEVSAEEWYYGDEVGMDGGADSDCRRDMLWDEARQNKELFRYYQTLNQIRHAYLSLTGGRISRQYVNDNRGLIYMERKLQKQRMIDFYVYKKAMCNYRH